MAMKWIFFNFGKRGSASKLIDIYYRRIRWVFELLAGTSVTADFDPPVDLDPRSKRLYIDFSIF
jgi:hypothetical protein